MAVYRYFVHVFQDNAGVYTAVPLEDLGFDLEEFAELAAVAATPKQALTELKQYLQWKAEQNEWLPAPDLVRVKEETFAISLRPSYRFGKREIFATRDLRTTLTYYTGKIDDRMHLAAVPRFGIRFTYFEDDDLKALLNRQVQSHFEGMTSERILLLAGAREGTLESVTVRVSPPKRRRYRSDTTLEILPKIACPLDGRTRDRVRFAPAWQRDEEVKQLTDVLVAEKGSALLLGGSGSGKTTLIAAVAAAQRRNTLNATPKYWMTSADRIIAGMKYLGEWEQRLEEAIREIGGLSGVLCFENLLNIMTVGGSSEGEGSIAAFLMPYVASGEIQIAVECTPEELSACRRKFPGMVDLLRPVLLPPLGRSAVLDVLARVVREKGKNTDTTVERSLLELIWHLHAKFHGADAFPGRAVGFLNELLDREVVRKGGAVTPAHCTELFTKKTGLPKVFLKDDMTLSASEVARTLGQDVIGQDAAVETAATLICTFKAGLNDPNRPIGTLLFSGPTGVGKTQLVKSIAKYCFGEGRDKERLLRFDMSEYSLPGSAERLLSDAEQDGVSLTARVRRLPFAVILFDEIEKAHAEVFDLLLSLLDEGRLTDPQGRTVRFVTTIIVMTSNLGAAAKPAVGFGARDEGDIEQAVKAFFKPEFFNRIDELVQFNPLGNETVSEIARKELKSIEQREGVEKRRLKIGWTDALIAFISKKGFHPRFGARFLQRAIEHHIAAPLAGYLLEHAVPDGTKITVDMDDDGVCFSNGRHR